MKYTEQPITEALEQNYMPYTMSVIYSRAIPEIDGFKPSHRKILYTMYLMKLLKGARTKSANVVGQTMKLNPHGDAAIYETMVRLSRGNESLLLPFIDSKGNFGKVTSSEMKYAAPRYTEVKLEPVCECLFRDIQKNNVDFRDNYDGTMQEPVLLPTVFPNILANPNLGIAVGMASSFPSFNLSELCRATAAFIENREIDLIEWLPAPDFPTGGDLICDPAAMRQIYDSGLGSFKLRGKVEYDRKENMLLITEIPYTTTVESIMNSVVGLIRKGRLKEVSDIRDETDLQGLKIAIDLKRGSEPDKVIAQLYKWTKLEDSFSCNMNLLVDGKAQVLGIKAILEAWLDFRKQTIKRAAQYDIEQLHDRLHLLYGLEKVLLDIDRAIAIIRETAREDQVISNLMTAFLIDEKQAEHVADIRLRNLNREHILKKTSEIAQLEEKIRDLRGLLGDDARIEARIVRELDEVAKEFGQPRKTRIAAPEEKEIDWETPIENFNVKVFLTAHGYFKKITLVSLRASGEHKLKDDDAIVQEYDAENIDEAIFFTNYRNAYKVKLYDLEETKASVLGIYLPNRLELEEGEEILYMVVTRDFGGHMIFGFENGKIARVPLEAYRTKQNRRKLLKAYSDESPLVRLLYLQQPEDITLIRQSGNEVKAMIVASELVPEKVTRNTQGVQAMRLRKGSKMVGLFQTARHPFSEEKYRKSTIPSSGEELDPMDAMTINQWIKS